MTRKKLTIGMATYDDYDGVYFSIQALRMYHSEAMPSVELLVIDNNPSSAHGCDTKSYCEVQGIRYIPFDEYNSTIVRNLIFENARSEFVLCMDCHVLFESGSIQKLIKFYEQNPNTIDLYHGPLLYDDLHNISTHFNPEWSCGMYGVWATDQRGVDKNAEPFVIPAQGMGVFTTRKDSWLRFNPEFRGFGGEEYYIHEKYRQAGRNTWCLPFLRWVHRFNRPGGTPYPNIWEQRIRNYIIGWQELNLDITELLNHFVSHVSERSVRSVCNSLNINLDHYLKRS